MLDFLYMIFLSSEGISEVVYGTLMMSQSAISWIKRIGLLILISSLGAHVHSSVPEQHQGGAQSPSTPDCSDPCWLYLECSGQTQFGQTQGAPLNNQASAPGEYGAQRAVSITIIRYRTISRHAAARNQAQRAPLPRSRQPIQQFVT